MPRQIEIEFEGHQLFRADLLEKEAPETCRQVWDVLPIETELGHGIYTGMVLYVQTDRLKVLKRENTIILGMAPGDICLDTRLNNLNEIRGGFQQIRIVCGQAIFFSAQTGWDPCNRFARIVQGDLDVLNGVWREVHTRGIQGVKVRRAE